MSHQMKKLVTQVVPGDLIWDKNYKDFVRVLDVYNRNFHRPSLRLLANYDSPLERSVEITTTRGMTKYSDKDKVLIQIQIRP
jgi:hypothetical protein